MGSKIPYLGIFGLKYEKNVVIFEIRILEFVTIELLTHTVNVCIGSTFSKGTGCAFSEGPGHGLGSLY